MSSSQEMEVETKPVVKIPMTEKCASNKAAMAIAGRALRPCDVCGRERAKWYCKADEAYLCENCDGSVHGANAVSLRHERIRLGPNGMLLRNVKRMSSFQHAEDDLPADGGAAAPSAPFSGSRKRPRSNRHSICKVKLEHSSSTHTIAKKEEDFLKSSLLNGDFDDELYEAKLELDEESSHQVPVLMPLMPPGDDSGVPNILEGFNVPCSSPTGTSDSDINEGIELCFDHFLEAEAADLCDMNEIISMEGMISDENVEAVLGLSEDSKEFSCYGLINFAALESSSNDGSEGEPDHCCPTPTADADLCTKVKLEEPDDLDKIKLEVDEMLGLAFSAINNSVKEEEVLEQKIKLRLNYEDVLNAWSDRGPFWTEGPRPQTVPDDSSFDPASTWDAGMVPDMKLESLHTGEAIAQVPVVNFGDDRTSNCGGREARVLRYREKRRTRLFSKKIRYEVRKLNAERRPRLKGRFVKRTLST